ncbi:nuclear transport factor 2 family protein [Sporosarcina sp. YIM B06819]|uniref:nuclear transport factor 2 family protein n=1 Tax=Sporosarcina sp. YIM B06819 TaxID=3081769 RepID=UPI00298D5DBB|nr:nuclear transport factor 2 family protein [Sporosarcina sp. YIM B06819]
MKRTVILLMMSMLLLLGACSKDEGRASNSGSVDDGETTAGYGAIDHGVDDKQVGFNMMGGSIEEAAGIPTEEKEQVLAAFNTYIDTLNNQDIDAHLAILSKNAYDIEEERNFMEEQFGEYALHYEVSNVTIVKYSDEEAQVYANMKMLYKQLSTGLETKPSGRQVTVFTKEDGGWKVSSVHHIPDGPKE